MTYALHRTLLLALLLVGSTAPVWAQLTVAPQSLSVTVEQYAEETRTLTLTNTGSEAVTFCLSFGRPLEGSGTDLALSEESLGSACGTYGEEFFRVNGQDLGIAWDPYGITMTPDGRIFTADYAGDRTHELTPELELVRSFEHPFVAECYPFPATTGVTYNADTGTLWWMNIDAGGFDVCSALLLEGDLNGVPTGWQIELPIAETAPEPYEGGSPVGASYDTVTDRYYFVDFANDDLWAVDTLGNVAGGYPVDPVFPYDQLGFGVVAHRSVEGVSETDGSTESLWLEVATAFPGEPRITRIVALDATGVWSGIETPVPVLSGDIHMNGPPLRSRLDPNGVMYYPFSQFQNNGAVAVRPHPLPPRWLSVDSVGLAPPAWDGTLQAGDSVEVPLTFRAAARPIGTYEAVLQVFDAATDAAIEVPLTMTVTQGTDAEDEPAALEASSLTVHPNPTAGRATATLALTEMADVRVVVYDVLGREVAVLHVGPLAIGDHEWSLDGRGLPSGLYLIHASTGRKVVTTRLTLLR